MRPFVRSLIAVVTIVLIFAGERGARAGPQEQEQQQQEQQQQELQQQDPASFDPKPTGRALPSAHYPGQDPMGDVRHDTRPLTGVQNPTLGSPQILHSYWVPGIQYSNMVTSAPLNRLAPNDWNSTSYIVGALSLLQVWRNAQLSVNYSGGGILASYSQGSGSLHRLEVVQAFEWKRWNFALFEGFSYLPETALTFGIGTSIYTAGIGGELGAALSGLQHNYEPGQTIFSSIGPRYSNSFTPQAVYAISPRGSINFAGSYGILRFSEAGNIDSNDGIFNLGYNYALTKNDAIGVLYRYAAYRYVGNPQALNDHVVQAAYFHGITGRLALQLFAGPELTTFRVPVAGLSRALGPSGGAILLYALRTNKLSLTYTHALNGGSGTLLGARADHLQVELGRRLTQRWSGHVNAGYALNRSVIKSGANESSPVYDVYYFGCGLSYLVGHDSTLNLTYNGQFQTSNQKVCVFGTCSTNYTRHDIIAGFSWHTRPFVLR
jgi:hypothetical protein